MRDIAISERLYVPPYGWTKVSIINFRIIMIITGIIGLISIDDVAQGASLKAGKAESSNERFIDLLTETMNKVRNNPLMGTDDSFIMSADPEVVLAAVKPFEDDSSPKVRHKAYTIAWQIAENSTSKKIRQEVVMKLLKAASDSDTLVWQKASGRILLFNLEDFSEVAKDSIRQLVVSDNPKRLLVLAAGVANLQDLETTLSALLIDESQYKLGEYGRWYGTVGWAARLALARMGSKENIASAIKLVESESDSVIRVAGLLKDVAFIRQPAAIEEIQSYLDSEEKLPPLHSMPGVCYCQYALDILAQIIEGFPIKSMGLGHSQSEIDEARKWMKKKSNWINSIRR